MGKSLFIYVKGTWKECTPYLNVGSTWKQVLEFNAKTAEVWKPERHVHTSVSIAAIPPTCTTIGYTSGKKCAECNEFLIEPQPIPSLEHQWTDWTTTEQPTDTSEGKQQRSCTQCLKIETTTVPKLDHTHNYISTPAKNATCTQKGNKAYYYCPGCQTYFDEQKQITTWSALEIAEDPTAHTGTLGYGGTKDIHTMYSCCSAVASRIHSITQQGSLKAAATCTSPATYYKKCVCGYEPKTSTGQYGSVDATNHTGTVVTGGTAEAHTKYSCCGATVSSTHNYTEPSDVLYAAATCTAKQKNYLKCACGYNPRSSNYTTEVGSALGHSWGAWAETKAATCLETGTQTRVCTRNSSHTETTTIPKLDHSYNQLVGYQYNGDGTHSKVAQCSNGCEATEVKSGKQACSAANAATCLLPSTCDTCGHTIQAALGHNMQYTGITKQIGGVTKYIYKCTRCSITEYRDFANL